MKREIKRKTVTGLMFFALFFAFNQSVLACSMCGCSSRGEEKSKETTTQVKDPVCGMKVNPISSEKMGLFYMHGGKKYFFCSQECMNMFKANPGKYVKESFSCEDVEQIHDKMMEAYGKAGELTMKIKGSPDERTAQEFLNNAKIFIETVEKIISFAEKNKEDIMKQEFGEIFTIYEEIKKEGSKLTSERAEKFYREMEKSHERAMVYVENLMGKCEKGGKHHH